jgi:hypothetical protein
VTPRTRNQLLLFFLLVIALLIAFCAPIPEPPPPLPREEIEWLEDLWIVREDGRIELVEGGMEIGAGDRFMVKGKRK